MAPMICRSGILRETDMPKRQHAVLASLQVADDSTNVRASHGGFVKKTCALDAP